MSEPFVAYDPDPVIQAYERDIDESLLRENLKLSVDERFRRLMSLQLFAQELRRAGMAVRRQAESDENSEPA